MADQLYTANMNGFTVRLVEISTGVYAFATASRDSNAPASGQKNVTTATTREALGGDQEYKKITIIAKTTNTGLIYLGSVAVTSSNGAILPAGGMVTLEHVNTNEVYIDASVSGEGVSWIGVI